MCGYKTLESVFKFNEVSEVLNQSCVNGCVVR